MSDLAFITVSAPPRQERNYYADLELPGRVDDLEIIKKQYKKLALLKHPDRGGNIDEFKIISDAYAFLMDPEEKPWYDGRRWDIPLAPTSLGGPELSRCGLPQDMVNPVIVVKGLSSKYVAYDQLDLAREEGWKHVVPATPSWRDPVTGEDTRECPVNDMSGPTEKFFPHVCKMLRDLGIDFESITLGPQEPAITPEEEGLLLGCTSEMDELNMQNGEPPPLTFVFESGEVEEFPPIPKEWLDSSAHGQEDQRDDGGDTGDT